MPAQRNLESTATIGGEDNVAIAEDEYATDIHIHGDSISLSQGKRTTVRFNRMAWYRVVAEVAAHDRAVAAANAGSGED